MNLTFIAEIYHFTERHDIQMLIIPGLSVLSTYLFKNLFILMDVLKKTGGWYHPILTSRKTFGVQVYTYPSLKSEVTAILHVKQKLNPATQYFFLTGSYNTWYPSLK